MEKIGFNIETITAIALLITILAQIYVHIRVARYTLFVEYTKRYQDLMFHFPEKWDDVTSLNNELKRYLCVYFDLCSEEYFLKKKGYLNRVVWKEWVEGMESTFSENIIKDYWQECKSGYPNFSKFVEDKILNK